MKTIKNKKVLVTGGAGYVGSIVSLALQQSGFKPIILDSYITGKKEFAHQFTHYAGNYGDKKILKKIFKEHPDIDHCIHCGAIVVVADSVNNPYRYYENNVTQSIELFKWLHELGCDNIIYSSTGSVYGNLDNLQVDESSRIDPHSPISRTKYFTELILQDFCNAYDMKAIILRYFNPIGASPDCKLGLPDRQPTHLIGKLLEASEGKNHVFSYTGTSWNTSDGTAIKDFVHIWDLAQAHVKAIKYFDKALKNSSVERKNYIVLNIGAGRGTTIKEFVRIFQEISGKVINTNEALPRSGDTIGQYASIKLAKKLIKWEPQLSVEDAIRSTLKWWKIRDSILNYKSSYGQTSK